MIRQTSLFMAGSPQCVGFHGDRFINPSFTKVSVAPTKGVTSKTPRKPAPQGGKGVSLENTPLFSIVIIIHAAWRLIRPLP